MNANTENEISDIDGTNKYNNNSTEKEKKPSKKNKRGITIDDINKIKEEITPLIT